jgi:hypothetical protein
MKKELEFLIIQYKNKLEDKKRLVSKIPNDIVEGSIYAYEKVIEDLDKLIKKII